MRLVVFKRAFIPVAVRECERTESMATRALELAMVVAIVCELYHALAVEEPVVELANDLVTVRERPHARAVPHTAQERADVSRSIVVH